MAPEELDKLKTQPIDLRDMKTMPNRTQYFTGVKGEMVVTNMCQSFTVANLIGHEVKVAVAPEDIAFTGYISVLQKESKIFDPVELTDETYIKHTGGSTAFFAQAVVERNKGYCRQKALDRFALKNYPGKSSLAALDAEVEQKQMRSGNLLSFMDQICGKRLSAGDFIVRENSVSEFTSSNEEDKLCPFLNVRSGLTHCELREAKLDYLREIDALLEAGRPAGLQLYNVHYVTIVGRKAHGEFIIQDSIPEAEVKRTWMEIAKNDPLNYTQKLRYEGGFQIWPRSTLFEAITGITWVEKKP